MQLKTYGNPYAEPFHVLNTEYQAVIFDSVDIRGGVVYLNTNGYACGQLYGKLADEFTTLWNNYEERI